MKRRVGLILPAMAMLAISCSQDAPPAQTADSPLTAAPPPVAAATPGKNASAAPSVPAIVAPPKDARYTIYCMGVTGPGHIERANEIKLLWQQSTRRTDWYVIHQDDQSNVYFGYYHSIDDPKDRDTGRAMADKKMIQNLKDSVGDLPFQQAILLPLDAPDPTAPPQWNLVNAKGAWSLEIAVYKGPDRKVAAVDSVRQARAAGIEAYYYHGPSASSVCIGTWPQEAVVQSVHGDLQNPDPNGSLFVVPDSLSSAVPDSMTDHDGNATKVLHNQTQVVDPTLTAAMQKYPTHSLDGYEDVVMVNGKPTPRSSAVILIPHNEQAPSANSSAGPAVHLLGGDGSTDSSSTGRLKSMGQ